MISLDDEHEGDVLSEETTARLGAAVAPIDIEADRAARMRLRAMHIPDQSAVSVLRAAEGEWQETQLPGIHVRILHIDRVQGTQTALWRLGPGAYFPPHSHARDEECLVLDGHVVSDEGIQFRQGDFLYAGMGTRHTGMTAPAGALLFVRNELPSELQSR